MNGQRGCVFVEGRACPFPSQEIPLQTCQVCVEAWKTEASLRLGASGEPVHAVSVANAGSIAEDQETLKRLGELDNLFIDDNLDPEEYVRLRKSQTDRIANGSRPRISLDELEVEAPEPREIRLALIVKSFMGNKVHTYPECWRLPAEINDGVVDRLLKLATDRGDEETRVGLAGYKVAVVRHAKGKLLIMVMDGDEEFQAYEPEMRRVSQLFQGEQHWVGTLREMKS